MPDRLVTVNGFFEDTTVYSRRPGFYGQILPVVSEAEHERRTADLERSFQESVARLEAKGIKL